LPSHGEFANIHKSAHDKDRNGMPLASFGKRQAEALQAAGRMAYKESIDDIFRQDSDASENSQNSQLSGAAAAHLFLKGDDGQGGSQSNCPKTAPHFLGGRVGGVEVDDELVQAMKHDESVVRKSSMSTSMNVDSSLQQQLLALSMEAASEANLLKNENAKNGAEEKGNRLSGDSADTFNGESRYNRFMNLEDDADMKSNKLQSFRIRSQPTVDVGCEGGGSPGARKGVVFAPGSESSNPKSGRQSKYESRNKSLRQMFASGRNLVKTTMSPTSVGRKLVEDTIEMTMDESGAAVIFEETEGNKGDE